MKLPNKPNNRYALVALSITVILASIFSFARGYDIISDSYVTIFIPVILTSLVVIFIANLMETRPGLQNVFFFHENIGTEASKLGIVPKIGIGLLLALVFSIGAVQLGSAIIDLPTLDFTFNSFAQVNDIGRVFFQSVIPGWFEELVIFVESAAVLFVLYSLNPNKKLLVLYQAVSAAVGATTLMFAHSLAYGSDTSAFLGIWLFEFVVQFANLFTGSFISWIPHIIHNGVVSLNFLVAFSIGGVALAYILPMRWKNARK